MLVAGFLLLAVSLYAVLLGVLKIGSWYGLSSVKHRRRLARTTAGVLSGIIALQSIGELSSRDILVLLPLALIAYLYMSYGRARPAVTPEIS